MPVIDYAVQPHPIEFNEQPQSQNVIEGDSVSLSCSFNVTPLANKYPLPRIIWRKNGKNLGSSESILSWSNIGLEDAGYYECLAEDGRRKFRPKGQYITSSRRASLQVLSKRRIFSVEHRSLLIHLCSCIWLLSNSLLDVHVVTLCMYIVQYNYRLSEQPLSLPFRKYINLYIESN